MTDTLVPVQHMSRPWFRANNFASALFAIVENHESGDLAPLGEGERRLGWFTLPPFQRPEVWTQAQKVRFIESIWAGLPLGSYIYNRTAPGRPFDNWLLDGQQRITAILDYVGDGFPVSGFLWSGLTEIDQRQFKMTPMACMETCITEEAKLREVYDRLAYGGTPHEPKAEDKERRLRNMTRALSAGESLSEVTFTDQATDPVAQIAANNKAPWFSIDAHEASNTASWRSARQRAELAYAAMQAKGDL